MKSFEEEAGSDDQCKFDQNGILRIGPFSFSSEISLSLKRRLMFLYRPIKSQISSLRLENGRLGQLIPEEALQMAESYTFQQLQNFQMANNKLSSLSFLQKCHFPNLTVLNLSRNHIYSLGETWNDLHFPNLEEIYLHNNHIANVRGIKRWRLPQLTKLTFELNFIGSIRQLSEAELPALRELTLYSNNITDLKPIFKAQFANLQILQIYQNKACNEKFILAILTKKFKFIEQKQAQLG